MIIISPDLAAIIMNIVTFLIFIIVFLVLIKKITNLQVEQDILYENFFRLKKVSFEEYEHNILLLDEIDLLKSDIKELKTKLKINKSKVQR